MEVRDKLWCKNPIMHAKPEDSCGVVEIPEAPEARYERRSKGIEATELCGKLGVRQQYDEITT
jgi:hypothetical protein